MVDHIGDISSQTPTILQQLQRARRERLARFKAAAARLEKPPEIEAPKEVYKITPEELRQEALQESERKALELTKEISRLRDALDQMEEQTSDQITLRQIILAVCAYYNVPKIDLLSKRRNSHLTIARHVAFYLARKHTLMSQPMIGKFMKRDHTSVIHGVRKIANQALTDPILAEDIKIIETELGVNE